MGQAWGLPGGANGEDIRGRGGSLGWEDPLEEGMATHSGILAWRIPRTEEPGGLQSLGSKESDTTEATHTNVRVSGFVLSAGDRTVKKLS